MMKALSLIAAVGILAPAMATDLERRDERDSNLYSSFGKRDPFRVPDKSGLGNSEAAVDPLRKYRLEGYRLRAILRTGGKPQAMFEDPDGKSHVVVEGDRLGMEGARVSRIVNSEVIVTERSANYLGKETLLEKVISLPSEYVAGSSGTASTVQQGFPGQGGDRVPSGSAIQPAPVNSSSSSSPAPQAAPPPDAAPPSSSNNPPSGMAPMGVVKGLR